MEKDDELKGDGNSINYEARMQDTRVGRFLSIDPLAKQFPSLTPYQFASNNPVSNVDLDGLEGVSYRVVRIDEKTGKKIPIKRIVEADIHIAVNSTGTCGAYTPQEKETLILENAKKYNEHGYSDEDGLTVEFKFNYIEFNPEGQDSKDYSIELFNEKVPTLYTKNIVGGNFETRKGVAMWKKKINPRGLQFQSSIRINPDRGPYPFGYAESHEIAHFLLMGEGFTTQVPRWRGYVHTTIARKSFPCPQSK